MRILILGASGGVGRWATRLAVGDGHRVTALVRPTTPFQLPDGVTLIRGSALDVQDLTRAIESQDAVVSCIGPQRETPWNPWSPLRAPGVAEQGVRAAVAALMASPVRRFGTISAAGVGESFVSMNGVMRWMLRHSTVGRMYEDLEAMERVLRQSELDWLAVRPVTLVNAPPSTRTRVVSRFRTVSVVGRADVAAWLLRVVVDPAPIGDRTPMIGWR